MLDTQPIPPDALWPSLEEWARTRLNSGLPWLPQGWSQWVAVDFAAHMLHRTLEHRAATRAQGLPRHAVAYDVQVEPAAFLGSRSQVALALNGHHSGEATVLVDIAAQSHHDTAEHFRDRLSLGRTTLATAPLLADRRTPGARAELLAIVVDPALGRDLVTRQGFRHRFSAMVGEFATGRDLVTFQFLSLGIDRGDLIQEA